MRILLMIFTLVGATGAYALDSAPKEIGKFTDWAAYEASENGAKVCWMVTTPKKSLPTNVNRGEIFMMVAHRPNDKVFNKLNVIIGYPFKPEANAFGSIDNKKYRLVTKDDAAWLASPEETDALIKDMRRGMEVIVKGTSTRGTDTTDTFSLRGFTKANRAITQACQ